MVSGNIYLPPRCLQSVSVQGPGCIAVYNVRRCITRHRLWLRRPTKCLVPSGHPGEPGCTWKAWEPGSHWCRFRSKSEVREQEALHPPKQLARTAPPPSTLLFYSSPRQMGAAPPGRAICSMSLRTQRRVPFRNVLADRPRSGVTASGHPLAHKITLHRWGESPSHQGDQESRRRENGRAEADRAVHGPGLRGRRQPLPLHRGGQSV